VKKWVTEIDGNWSNRIASPVTSKTLKSQILLCGNLTLLIIEGYGIIAFHAAKLAARKGVFWVLVRVQITIWKEIFLPSLH